MEDCPACGYPIKIIKTIPGSLRSRKKVKVKCTSVDCIYEGTIVGSEDEYQKAIERSDRDKILIEQFKNKAIE